MAYAFVIAVSGWRLHADKDFVTQRLAATSRYYLSVGYELFFRVGDAKGADAIAREWLTGRFPHSFKVYDADWDQFGLTAGPTRNREMLQGVHDPYGLADLLIAFPQPGVYRYKDSGTWGCVKEAFRLGVEVQVPRYRLDKGVESN